MAPSGSESSSGQDCVSGATVRGARIQNSATSDMGKGDPVPLGGMVMETPSARWKTMGKLLRRPFDFVLRVLAHDLAHRHLPARGDRGRMIRPKPANATSREVPMSEIMRKDAQHEIEGPAQ